MKVIEYLLSDVSKEYDECSISVQDEEGNILYYADKYDIIVTEELNNYEVLKVEYNNKEKYLIFVII